jgi:hypothetical protein
MKSPASGDQKANRSPGRVVIADHLERIMIDEPRADSEPKLSRECSRLGKTFRERPRHLALASAAPIRLSNLREFSDVEEAIDD